MLIDDLVDAFYTVVGMAPGAPSFLIGVLFLVFYHRMQSMLPLRGVGFIGSVSFLGLCVLSFYIYMVIMVIDSPGTYSFRRAISILFVWSCLLYIFICEILMRGLAKKLCETRGSKWAKELEYVYLTFAGGGIVVALNRIELFAERFENLDFFAQLLLATALVIRFVKTRVEIKKWNDPPITWDRDSEMRF